MRPHWCGLEVNLAFLPLLFYILIKVFSPAQECLQALLVLQRRLALCCFPPSTACMVHWLETPLLLPPPLPLPAFLMFLKMYTWPWPLCQRWTVQSWLGGITSWEKLLGSAWARCCLPSISFRTLALPFSLSLSSSHIWRRHANSFVCSVCTC